MLDKARPAHFPHVCLTRNTEVVTSRPGPTCQGTISDQLLSQDPKRTVCDPCRDKLIEGYYKMAIWAARKIWSRHSVFYRRMDREDAEAVGLTALVKCAARYDPSKGKLSTILIWWVRSELQDHTVHHGGAVSVPTSTSRHTSRVTKYQNKVRAALKAPLSLEYVGSNALRCYSEADEEYDPADLHPRMEEIKAEVIHGGGLQDREREVLLDNLMRGKSLAQIGRENGYTKEYARQLKSKAVRSVKAALREKGIVA